MSFQEINVHSPTSREGKTQTKTPPSLWGLGQISLDDLWSPTILRVVPEHNMKGKAAAAKACEVG